MLKKPQPSGRTNRKTGVSFVPVDLMNTDQVKWENVGIYGGATALITLEPHAAVALKVVDVGNLTSTCFPKATLVAGADGSQILGQTALLMDINAPGDPNTTPQSQVRSGRNRPAPSLLGQDQNPVEPMILRAHVQKGQTMKHLKTTPC